MSRGKQENPGKGQAKREKPGYFEEALADFVHDSASGGAIRHLADQGYTTDQIMERLDFPTPRARVEKTVYRYMTDCGILRETLPVLEEDMRHLSLKNPTERELCAALRARIEQNGEEASYVSCPFFREKRSGGRAFARALSCLTSREIQYIEGMPLPERMAYHRLNSRMMEISVQLAVHSVWDMKFYFLNTQEVLCVEKGRNKGES